MLGCIYRFPLALVKRVFTYIDAKQIISRLTVVSREAKEEVPCDGLSTNAREYIYKNKPC